MTVACRRLLPLLAAALLAPTIARAEASAPAGDAAGDAPSVLLSARAGAVFPGQLPGLFNERAPSHHLVLGGGWVVPALQHRLALVLDGSYEAPVQEQTLSDPRLAAGGYAYTLTQEDLSLFVGGHWHFGALGRDAVVPYAGLGARVHLYRTTLVGEAGGEPIGESVETSTEGGLATRGGVAVKLGPGFVDAQLELAFAPIAHVLTGEVAMAGISAAVGYTLSL